MHNFAWFSNGVVVAGRKSRRRETFTALLSVAPRLLRVIPATPHPYMPPASNFLDGWEVSRGPYLLMSNTHPHRTGGTCGFQQLPAGPWKVKRLDPDMLVGMKNLVWDDETTEDLAELAQSFDFGINEECYQYDECGVRRPQ